MREKAVKQAEPSHMDITKVFLLLKVSKAHSNMSQLINNKMNFGKHFAQKDHFFNIFFYS
jgi:hypothetical protein